MVEVSDIARITEGLTLEGKRQWVRRLQQLFADVAAAQERGDQTAISEPMTSTCLQVELEASRTEGAEQRAWQGLLELLRAEAS